jgi:hypothetical protein
MIVLAYLVDEKEEVSVARIKVGCATELLDRRFGYIR